LSGGIGEQAAEAGRDLKERVADTAKELGSEAGEKLRATAEEQKAAGADRITGIAEAIRRAADAIEGELPQASPYIRRAAAELETVSETVRRRDVRELVRNVQDFARKNPTVFIGGSILAGIVLVRFLKSSSQSYQDRGDNKGTTYGRTSAETAGDWQSQTLSEGFGTGAAPGAPGAGRGQSASGDPVSREEPGFTPASTGSGI
jgi:hypothetical protein